MKQTYVSLSRSTSGYYTFYNSEVYTSLNYNLHFRYSRISAASRHFILGVF